jgi:L-2-hydroxycarboxylate dehydrogenase (NAD+)
LKAVLEDILKEGNENCLLPGEMEAKFAQKTEKNQGLLFSKKELEEFAHLAHENAVAFDVEQFSVAT